MAKDDGWVAVSRGLLDVQHDLHPWTTGEPACRLGAWVDLIGYAQWKSNGDLDRGQLRASVRFLAKRWNWSKSKVSRFLQELRDAKRIKRGTQAGREPDIITIRNYDSYQIRPSSNGTQAGHERDANRDKEEQVLEQEQLTTTAAVGEFLERTGSKWRLDRTITEWVREIESEPKYAGVDHAYEIHKCTDWHVGKGKTPKAPDMSMRNWLERAASSAEEKRRERSRYTGPRYDRLN